MSGSMPSGSALTREQMNALVSALWPAEEIQHIAPAQLAWLAETHTHRPVLLKAPRHSALLCHLQRCEQCNENLFALIELASAEHLPVAQAIPSPDLSFLRRGSDTAAAPSAGMPPRLDLALRLAERATVLAQRATVVAAERFEAALARRLDQSRRREQSLGQRLDRMEALQAELETQVLRLIEWTRAQLSDGLSARIWSVDWLPSSLKGTLIDLAMAMASLGRTIRQPIQEMLLEMRLNRVKMRRSVLEKDLERTRAQQAALTLRLEEMRTEAAIGASPLESPPNRARRS